MRTACTYHDSCVNNKIIHDLAELEMACNVSVQERHTCALPVHIMIVVSIIKSFMTWQS